MSDEKAQTIYFSKQPADKAISNNCSRNIEQYDIPEFERTRIPPTDTKICNQYTGKSSQKRASRHQFHLQNIECNDYTLNSSLCRNDSSALSFRAPKSKGDSSPPKKLLREVLNSRCSVHPLNASREEQTLLQANKS